MVTLLPNNEVRPSSALLFLAICELAFLLAWVRSLRVMVMMSPTLKALRSLYRFWSKPAW
ncbi:hypothetical protein D3C81_1620210 [compost metagenome]